MPRGTGKAPTDGKDETGVTFSLGGFPEGGGALRRGAAEGTLPNGGWQPALPRGAVGARLDTLVCRLAGRPVGRVRDGGAAVLRHP